MLACPIEDVKIEQGADHLIHYKWNTKVATHHFCSNCGIMTHHQRRTTPEICGINVGCIDELDYRSFQDVPMNNGIELTLVEQWLDRVLVAHSRNAFAPAFHIVQNLHNADNFIALYCSSFSI